MIINKYKNIAFMLDYFVCASIFEFGWISENENGK